MWGDQKGQQPRNLIDAEIFYFPLIIFISFLSSFYFSLLVVLFLYVDCIAGC